MLIRCCFAIPRTHHQMTTFLSFIKSTQRGIFTIKPIESTNNSIIHSPVFDTFKLNSPAMLKIVSVLILGALIAGSGAQNSTSSTTRRPPPRPTAPVAPSVINGERAVLGEIPHQAYIQWTESACGASLIQPNWILTAAHCLYQAPNIEVRMGGTNRDNMPFITTAPLANIFVHEGYNPDTLFNDVGLVKLTENAVGDNISPIPMATSGDFTGIDVRASGFGITEEGTQSADLLKIDLRTITNQECSQVYHSAPELVTDNTLCVTWKNMEGDNVCNGDSGGPLSTLIDGQQVLIGVASFVSSNGCQAGDPAGFSRTSAFADWIQRTMDANP